MSPQARRAFLLHNLAAYLFGGTLMVLSHEAMHWFTGAALGFRSTMYSYGVTHAPEPTGIKMATTALAAVLGSMLLGLVMALWQPLRRRGGFGHLLWLWFAFTSMQEGVTYWMLTATGAGDTATAAAALGWPVWLQIVLTMAGVGGMFVTARLFARPVADLAGDLISDRRAMTIWPWLLAIPFQLAAATLGFFTQGMALTIGEVVVISMASIATGTFAPMSLIFSKLAQAPSTWQPPQLPAWPVIGIVGYVAMLVLHVLMRGGITIGG